MAIQHSYGVIVPMVTPLTVAGRLDESAVYRIIEHLLAGGAHGIFVLGTTGEMSSLERPLRRRLVEIAVEHVNGRAQTYAGISNPNLEQAATAGREYLQIGIDAVVAYLPGPSPLDAREQYAYYCDLLQRISGPLVLYNMPKITQISMPFGLLEDLASHPQVIGLKDSENDAVRLERILARLGGRKDFSILTGVTSLAASAMRGGGDGFVPSVANLVPNICQRLYDHATCGDWPAVEHLQKQSDRIASVYQRNRSLGHSLAALKVAMHTLDLCGPTVAPPLQEPEAAEQLEIQRELTRLELV